MPKFRSKFEEEVYNKYLAKNFFVYEPFDVEYMVPESYKPDFVRERLILETKGRFRSYKEAQYYRNLLPILLTRKFIFYFVFQNPNVYAYPRVKMTISKWADHYGFRWIVPEEIPKVIEKYFGDE